jgi:hypothetical protein
MSLSSKGRLPLGLLALWCVALGPAGLQPAAFAAAPAILDQRASLPATPNTSSRFVVLSDRLSSQGWHSASSEIGPTVAAPLPAAKAPLLPADQSPSFSFTAGGDYGSGSDVDKVLNGIAGSGSNFSLILGDLSYNSMSPESSWCNYIKSHLGSTYPVELLSGNHEDSSPYESYGGTIDTFAGCLPNRIGGLTGTYAHEYYFDYPQASPIARFILIEPDEYRGASFVDYSAGTARYNWVAAAIDDAHAKGIKWVIAGMHKVYLDMGTYRGDSMGGGDGIGPGLFNLFLSKKVDLVLNAHYHSYQRTKQLALSSSCLAVSNNSYNSACVADANASGAFVKGKGTVDVINGASGFSLYDIDTARPEAPYFAKWMGGNVNKSFGYLKVTVSSSQLSAQFTPTTGTFTDSFSITDKSSGPTPGPTATRRPPGSGSQKSYLPWVNKG